MNDTVEKILLAALGFLVGTATTLIVDVVRARTRRLALLALMTSEAHAFADACRSSEKHKNWTSSDARRLAELLRERYSKDPERWTAPKSPQAQKGVAMLYLESAALLDLIALHETQEREKRESRAIGPGTYEGIARRTDELVSLLERDRALKWKFGHGG